MAARILKSVLLVGAAVALLSFDMPEGWYRAGDEPKSYEMGIDKGAGQDGKDAATIQSVKEKIKGFGTLMQSCLPDKYLGKRVRMTGFMKSKDVKDWAGFWFRVDQANSDKSLSFDNMEDRAIKGTTDWKKYEIVLDVPINAYLLHYGALLSGTGQIWFDNLTFEIVDNSVPTTGNNYSHWLPQKEPTNLNFD